MLQASLATSFKNKVAPMPQQREDSQDSLEMEMARVDRDYAEQVLDEDLIVEIPRK